MIPEARRIPKLSIQFEPCDPNVRASRIGGVPNAWEGEAWPICARCHEPLAFFVQVVGPLSVGTIEINAGDAVQIFACLHEDPCTPETAVGFWRAVGEGPQALPDMPEDSEESFEVLPAHRLITAPGFDDALLLDESAMDDHDAWQEAFALGFGNKLGGIEVSGVRSIPEPEFPLLAQLVLDDSVLPNGYGGAWFVYIAPASRRVSVSWH